MIHIHYSMRPTMYNNYFSYEDSIERIKNKELNNFEKIRYFEWALCKDRVEMFELLYPDIINNINLDKTFINIIQTKTKSGLIPKMVKHLHNPFILNDRIVEYLYDNYVRYNEYIDVLYSIISDDRYIPTRYTEYTFKKSFNDKKYDIVDYFLTNRIPRQYIMYNVQNSDKMLGYIRIQKINNIMNKINSYE
jgi:hypothetical protein